jgi:hypothetical protein
MKTERSVEKTEDDKKAHHDPAGRNREHIPLLRERARPGLQVVALFVPLLARLNSAVARLGRHPAPPVLVEVLRGLACHLALAGLHRLAAVFDLLTPTLDAHHLIEHSSQEHHYTLM